MQIHWKTFITRTIVWLTAELLLTVLGLDTVADYGEFLTERYPIVYLG